jgi:hypothetical protein
MDQATQLDLQRHPVRVQIGNRCWHFSTIDAAVVTGWWECGGGIEDFDLIVNGRALAWGEKRAAFLRAMETEGAAV